MSSQGESEPTEDVVARVQSAQQKGRNWHRSKGGEAKNSLYCPTCKAELDEPNGACEFCARADAVLEDLA